MVGRTFTRNILPSTIKPSSGESPISQLNLAPNFDFMFMKTDHSNAKEFGMKPMSHSFITGVMSGGSGLQRSEFSQSREKIRQFDSLEKQVQVKIEDEVNLTDESFLQKRKRGRPKKNQGERIVPRKKVPEKEQEIKEDSLVFMNEHAHIFESDSEEQQIALERNDIENLFLVVFSNNNGMAKSTDFEERNKSFRLDIGKLIKAIESEQAKNKIKKFVCRFCGKAFDKPSSLGGHTAKTHNGLSLKYKNRLTAAKNRKTERSRIQFLKQSIHDEFGTDVGPTS